MGDLMLNGRKATDAELAAFEHARERERQQWRELLAGVLTEDPRVVPLPAADVLSALP